MRRSIYLNRRDFTTQQTNLLDPPSYDQVMLENMSHSIKEPTFGSIPQETYKNVQSSW